MTGLLTENLVITEFRWDLSRIDFLRTYEIYAAENGTEIRTWRVATPIL